MSSTCSAGRKRPSLATAMLTCGLCFTVGCPPSAVEVHVVGVDVPATGLSVRVVDLAPEKLTVEPTESWIHVQQKGKPTPRAELRPNYEFTVFRPNVREDWRLVGIDKGHAVFDVVSTQGDVWVFPIGLITSREEERVFFCGSATKAHKSEDPQIAPKNADSILTESLTN